MFLPITSVRGVFGVTVFGALFGAYILATAVLSPTPPLVAEAFGAFLVVSGDYLSVCGTSVSNKCLYKDQRELSIIMAEIHSL